jgi:hypothetical protein
VKKGSESLNGLGTSVLQMAIMPIMELTRIDVSKLP